MRYLIYLSLFSVLACGRVKQEDTSEIRAEIERSKIKRVTEKDLMQEVSVWGEQAKKKWDADYRVECQQTYVLDDYTLEVYNKDLPVEGQGVKSQLIEAYSYGLQQGQPVGTNIQKLNDTLFIYSFPLSDKSYLKQVCKQDFAFVLLSSKKIISQIK